MQKMWLFMSLLAVLGSHGIVVKCTAAIFSGMVDCNILCYNFLATGRLRLFLMDTSKGMI